MFLQIIFIKREQNHRCQAIIIQIIIIIKENDHWAIIPAELYKYCVVFGGEKHRANRKYKEHRKIGRKYRLV